MRHSLLAMLLLACVASSTGYAESRDVRTDFGFGPTFARRHGNRSDAMAGLLGSYSTGQLLRRSGPIEIRGYLIFNLTDVTIPVKAAELRTFQGSVSTPDLFETVNVFDVTTPPDLLYATAIDSAVFNDLGSGILYGSSSPFPKGSSTTMRTIPLNAAAVDAINANLGGYFSIGLALDTLAPGRNENETVFGNISPPVIPILNVTFIPEPSAFVIAASSLFAFSFARRRTPPLRAPF